MDEKNSNFKSKVYSLRGLFIIGSADIFGSVISVAFWLIVASLLIVEEYGQLTYLIAIASLVQSSSVIGSSNTLMVYASKKPELIQSLILLSFLAAIVGSIVVLVISQKFEIIFIIFSFLILELSSTILLGKKLYSQYSKFIITQKVLQLILGIGLYHLIGFNGLLIGIILANLPLLFILLKELKNFKFNFSGLKESKEFILNNYFSHLISIFRRDIDKIIIAPLLGFVVLGNFSFLLQIYTIMMIASSISYKYLLPENVSQKKNKRLKKYLILLSILISISGFFLSPIFIENLFPKFIESIFALQILSFTVIPGTIGSILTSKILALEKSRILILAYSVQLCSVVLGTIFLGLYFGLVGLALSFLIASISNVIILITMNYYHIGDKKFDI